MFDFLCIFLISVYDPTYVLLFLDILFPVDIIPLSPAE